LGREVEDIEAVVTWLNKQGVTLEKYPFVQDRERGIWTTPNADKVGWFKDPDGNVIGEALAMDFFPMADAQDKH
jgi:hypothetical protein